ncbi:MAG: signal peptidase I [Clostridia bacterium]|nr:signal peptidase I [Clostridia bacterium]
MGKLGKMIKEVIITIVLAICISFILQTFVIQARYVPTGSMLPTIELDQRILVNKLIYKFKTPERGDIIVFEPPIESDDNKDYIKRVIGLPGDKIEVKDGYVYVNDTPLHEPYIYEKPKYRLEPVIVPDNCLFVLGDNRNQSYDSHIWDTWLTMDQVKGKAFFTYWPLEKMGVFKTEVKSAHTHNK